MMKLVQVGSSVSESGVGRKLTISLQVSRCIYNIRKTLSGQDGVQRFKSLLKKGDSMGYGFRLYIFEDDGKVRHLPFTKYQRFRWGKELLPEYANEAIRTALVSLEVQGRHPIKILSIDTTVIYVDVSGRASEKWKDRAMRFAGEALDSFSAKTEADKERFHHSKMRYWEQFKWTASPKEMTFLRQDALK